jgi:hypothetical protein
VRANPAISDLDGDGLAELVAGEDSSGGVVALTNELGGWSVLEADRPWFGADHHPDSMQPSGQVGQITPESVSQGHNVWNGRPAVPPQCSQALTLEIRDVCAGNCSGDAVVTVYVANAGILPVSSGVSLQLWAGDQLLGEAPLPDVQPETAVPVQLFVPADDLVGTLEARLAGSIDGDCEVPVATWSEPVCQD